MRSTSDEGGRQQNKPARNNDAPLGRPECETHATPRKVRWGMLIGRMHAGHAPYRG